MERKALITFLLLSFIAVSSYAQPNRVEVTYPGSHQWQIHHPDPLSFYNTTS